MSVRREQERGREGDVSPATPSVGRRVSTVVIAVVRDDSSVVGQEEIEEWVTRWRRWLVSSGMEEARVSLVWLDREEACDER
jgi:Asp-tRNA(Asn)/Glu-tRNA(Gln) amidotransferase A subunit family amidase